MSLIVFGARDLKESCAQDSYFAHIYQIMALKRAVYLCLQKTKMLKGLNKLVTHMHLPVVQRAAKRKEWTIVVSQKLSFFYFPSMLGFVVSNFSKM